MVPHDKYQITIRERSEQVEVYGLYVIRAMHNH